MAPTNSFCLLTYDELKQLPPTKILDSTHLVERGFNVIFGPSGTYKSFYILGLALRAAQTEPVVFVAAEGSGGLARRIEAWCGYYKLPPGHVSFICSEVNLMDAAKVGEFVVAVKKTMPRTALVILDTYARCIPGGDENSSKDCGIAIRHCAHIQRRLDTAVVLIHHTNRAERGERGSGALRGAADSMIEVSHREDGLIQFDCSKMKDEEPWESEFYGFSPYGTSGILLPSADLPSTIALSQREMKVLEFLSLDVFEKCGAETRRIVGGTKIAESSIYRVLSGLKRNSHIFQDTKGDPYSITEEGKRVLNLALSKSLAPPKLKENNDLSDELSNSQVTIN